MSWEIKALKYTLCCWTDPEAAKVEITYQLHTQGAVVDGLILQINIQQRFVLTAVITRAKRDGQKRLVAHLCVWLSLDLNTWGEKKKKKCIYNNQNPHTLKDYMNVTLFEKRHFLICNDHMSCFNRKCINTGTKTCQTISWVFKCLF